MSVYYNPRLQEDLADIFNHTENVWEEFRNQQLFLTGGTGFFGKWLLESFNFANQKLSLNATVTVLTRNTTSFLTNYPYFDQPWINFIEGDILNFDLTHDHYNFIIHGATDADAQLNNENPLLMMDTITLGTRKILDFAKKQEALKSFLFISSGAVYGTQPENITHTAEAASFPIDINNPANAYAEGKRIAELYTSTYFEKFNLPVKIARCFAFVGPYLPLDKHFAIGNFIRNVLNEEEIVIKGDGSPFRSYLYAADLTIWLWQILTLGEIGKPYNVGSDEDYSISDIAKIVSENHPNVKTKILGKPNENLPIARYVPSISYIKSELDLEVYHSLAQSVKKTLKFYESL